MHFVTRRCRLYSNIIARLPSRMVSQNLMPTRHFDEITIPLPSGYLAGKWYGPKNVRPLVGLHGWQDNAGTFDTLAPLLTSHISLLSIDLPGHGFSSWLPKGLTYHAIDYISVMRHLIEEFNWEKISIMGHSLSSINGAVFCALFPDKIDMLIGLDGLKPPTRSAAQIMDTYAENLEKTLKIEKQMGNNTEPPSYDWDQLVERLHTGSQKSVKLEVCKFLLHRNVKPSKHAANKYYFSRDGRLKTFLLYPFSQAVSLEIMRRIKCPHLFIKASQGPYYENKEYYDEALEVRKQCPFFEYHEVEGTHHVHLNEPPKIAPIVNSFINKWRPQ